MNGYVGGSCVCAGDGVVLAVVNAAVVLCLLFFSPVFIFFHPKVYKVPVIPPPPLPGSLNAFHILASELIAKLPYLQSAGNQCRSQDTRNVNRLKIECFPSPYQVLHSPSVLNAI